MNSHSHTAPEGENKPAILIIGHRGGMGDMLLRRWREAGYTVSGVDREPAETADASGSACGSELRESELASLMPQSDIVVICVPVSALQEVAAQLGPLLRPGQLLMDITSVKELPMRWMEEAFSGPVVGSHPLFGPVPAPGENRVILVRGGNTPEQLCRVAEALYTDIGCVVSWHTAAEHDAGTALAQSLNFAMSACFFSTIARNPQARPFLTPSFDRHLEAARKHLTLDTAMFCEFSAYNPQFPEALRQYINTLERAASGGLSDIASEAAIWYNNGH